MKKIFNHIFTIVFIATLSIALTNCRIGDPTPESAINEEATIEARVNATLTAESAINLAVDAGIKATLNAMQTSVPPMETIIQPTMTSGNDAGQTESSTPEPPSVDAVELPELVTISSPANGDHVPQLIKVSGYVDKSALGGRFLNVIVTTQAGEHFVQIVPDVLDDSTWSSAPVHIGSAVYGVGEKFKICAVIANQQSPVDQIYTYPDGPKACIEVIRE